MNKRRNMTPVGQGDTYIRPGKPISAGMGGGVKSGTGSAVRSRSFGEPAVTVKALFNPDDIDRVDRDMQDESMADKLGLPVESYRQAIRGGSYTSEPMAGASPRKVTTEQEPLYLAKGGLVRDCADHMAESRHVDRMPSGAKHSKR